MAKATTKPAPKADQPAVRKLPVKKVRVRNQVQKGKHGGTMIVLVDDLAHVGKQGDLVEVKAGYARNYLLPYGKAVIPTPNNLRELETYKIKVSKAKEARIADLKVLAEQLTRLPALPIEANAYENVIEKDGQTETHYILYGSIGAGEISKALKAKNLGVEPDMVKLAAPLKEANILYDIPLGLGYGIESKIQVFVVAFQNTKK